MNNLEEQAMTGKRNQTGEEALNGYENQNVIEKKPQMSSEQMVAQLIEEVSPEIEKQIRLELNTKYQDMLEEEINQMRIKAKKSCEDVVEERIEQIHEKQLAEYKQRKDAIQQKERDIYITKAQMASIIEAELKPVLEQQKHQQQQKRAQVNNSNNNNNNTKVSTNNSSQKYEQVAQEIRDRMNREWKERRSAELSKKERLLKLNYQRKFEEEREQLRQQQQRLVESECEKQLSDIDAQRANIAQQTAVQNLQMKTCQSDKQQLLLQRQQIEQNFNITLQDLQAELNGLLQQQQELQDQQQQQMQQQQQQQYQQAQQYQQQYPSGAVDDEWYGQPQTLNQKAEELHNKQQDQGEEHNNNNMTNQQLYQQQHMWTNHNTNNNLFENINSNNNTNNPYNILNQEINNNDNYNNYNTNQYHNSQDNHIYQQDNQNNNALGGLFNQQQQSSQPSQNKSPFMLSMTKKLASTAQPDTTALNQQLLDSSKHLPKSLELLAPPQPIFLPAGESFLPRDKSPSTNLQAQQQSSQSQLPPPKFTLLQQYNTAEMAGKILDQIKEGAAEAQSNPILTTPSQKFTQLFEREIGNPNSNTNASLLDKLREKMQSNNGGKKDKSFNGESNQQRYLTTQGNENNQNNKSTVTFNNNTNENHQTLYQTALDEEHNERRRTLKEERNSRRATESNKYDKTIVKKPSAGPLSKYNQLFIVTEGDSEKTKKMKLLHQKIERQIQFDEELHQELAALQTQVFNAFIPQIRSESTQEEVQAALKDIICSWERNAAPIESRIAFLQEILATEVRSVSEINGKLQFEREYMESVELGNVEKQLILLLDTRYSFRKQIDVHSTTSFTYRNHKRIYAALKSLDMQIAELLLVKYPKIQSAQQLRWKGIDPEDLLALDRFEEDLLQKHELTEEISRKIGKKF